MKCVCLLSPHPNPLPQGEGTAGNTLLLANVCAANTAAGFFARLETILPLPKGEGRGEGNANANKKNLFKGFHAWQKPLKRLSHPSSLFHPAEAGC